MPLTHVDDERVSDFYDRKGCEEGLVTSFSWDLGHICWSNNPFCWDDVAITAELLDGGASPIDTFESWDEPKKEKFIKLVAKVKGYEQVTERKKKKNVKVTASDIKLVVEKVLNVKIDIE